MRLLSSDHRAEVTSLFHSLKRGDGLSQADMDRLVKDWEQRVEPDRAGLKEWFAVTRADGTTTGVIGPRWIFHLLGLRHRATEIGFHTQSGLIVLQRRSAAKEDWPDAPDMAVAGHIPQNSDGSDISFGRGAWKEIAEEIGLDEQRVKEYLVEGELVAIGPPYNSLDIDDKRNPPFYNAEVRQIFGGTLTGAALANIRFTDGEVTGLILVTREKAWQMLIETQVASGMRYSLPRYLDWLERISS